MDWLWHALVVCFIVIPVTVMWIAIIVELFRRHDLSAFARVAWLVLLFVLPLIGAFTYVIVTWRRGEGDVPARSPSAKAPAHSDPAAASTVSDLTELDRLRRTGVITEEEFAQGKSRVLQGGTVRPTSKGATT